MTRNKQIHRTTRQAFSLIELLVVIAVIGILVTIGVAVGFKVFASSDASDTLATQERVMNVVQRYYDIEGSYPISTTASLEGANQSTRNLIDDLMANETTEDMLIADCADAIVSVDTNSDGTIDDRWLVDAWDQEMRYTSSGLGGQPALISAGEDGSFGTDDDVRTDKGK